MRFGKFTKIMTWAIGAVLVASVAWAATYWRVDSYGNIKAARSSVLLSAGEVSNCKLDISGTTLSVIGQNDAALSVSNPCLVGLNNGSVATFSAPVSVTFGAASDTDGNLFGIVDANWASVMNMKVGVITDGTDSYFTLSRVPLYISGSAATDLCQKADTDCDDHGDAMILATGLALASWVDLQVTQVGYLDATYATAGGAWTFAVTAPAGFNFEYAKIRRTMPLGQMGSAAGKMFADNGGTAPQGTSESHYYYETPDGWVRGTALSAGGDLNGAGVVNLLLSLPFKVDATDGSRRSGWVLYTTGGAVARIGVGYPSLGNTYALHRSTADASYLMNSTLDDNGDSYYYSYEYKMEM